MSIIIYINGHDIHDSFSLNKIWTPKNNELIIPKVDLSDPVLLLNNAFIMSTNHACSVYHQLQFN